MEEQASSFSFWQALVGFSVALLIFWIQEVLRDFFEKRNLIEALKFELDHNLYLYSEIREGIVQEICEPPTNQAREIQRNPPRDDLIARHFTTKLYESGLASLYFSPSDMVDWNCSILRELNELPVEIDHQDITVANLTSKELAMLDPEKRQHLEALCCVDERARETTKLRKKLNTPLYRLLLQRFCKALTRLFR
jgi:hypothetical protein